MSKMLPLPTAETALGSIRLVATDLDGTLTIDGKLSRLLLHAFERLSAAKIEVLIVTGRSAGWVSGLANYLPVWGAIAENGGLVYLNHATTEQLLVGIPDLSLHRQQLAAMFQHLQVEFPALTPSLDNRFRLTDWTFDIQNLTIAQVEQMRDRCLAAGWGFTYSTVQCHIKLPQQEKAAGLQQIRQQFFPQLAPTEILTVGDSPNDESLFDARQFPYSVGVANVQEYVDRLTHKPTYITRSTAGSGFAELVQVLTATSDLRS
jgi:HAD superfamily hydrolase (TIGR01484 family)